MRLYHRNNSSQLSLLCRATHRPLPFSHLKFPRSQPFSLKQHQPRLRLLSPHSRANKIHLLLSHPTLNTRLHILKYSHELYHLHLRPHNPLNHTFSSSSSNTHLSLMQLGLLLLLLLSSNRRFTQALADTIHISANRVKSTSTLLLLPLVKQRNLHTVLSPL